MILKNFYGYLREMSRVGMSITTSSTGLEQIQSSYLKDITNSTNYVYRYSSDSYRINATYAAYLFQMKSPFYGLHMRFGTGDTPVNINDYRLSSDITSSIGSRTNSITRDWVDDKGLIVTIISSGINNTSDPITINEIGLAKIIQLSDANTTTSYPYDKTFLFTRDVLEEPITVQPGSSFRIDYNWIVN